jgi:hypothetical protein
MRLRTHIRFQGLAIVVLCLAVAACEVPFREYPSDAVRVENQSSQTVVLDLGSLTVGTLRPNEEFLSRMECEDADFVVKSSEGEELARRPGPFCQGDPPWIITDELLGSG